MMDLETLTALIAHLPVAFLTLEHGLCTYANDAARQLLDTDPLGKPIDSMVQFCDRAPERIIGRTSSGRLVRGVTYNLPSGLVAYSLVDFTEEARAQRESAALARMASGLTWSGSLDETMATLAVNAAQAVDARAAAVVLR
ncbi:MAG: hypothetical protein ACYCW6_19595, partial [Candidatus Xenobia bacterium]